MMMKLRTVIVVLLLMKGVSAVTINNIDIAVDETGYVTVKERLTIPRGAGFFETWIPLGAEEFGVTGQTGSLAFNSSTADDRLYLGVNVPGKTRNRDVTLSYGSSYLTTKTGSEWALTFSVPSTPHRTIVKVTLPFNSTIIDWEPKIPFSPDQGGLNVFPETEEFNFTLKYGFGGVPARTNYLPLSALALLVLLTVVAFTILKRRRRIETKEEVKHAEGGKRVTDSVIKTLEENERRIVKILQDAEGEITQATIYNETHIPKSSLSDIMKRLERRNIIERKREGRRNWVKLKDDVLE